MNRSLVIIFTLTLAIWQTALASTPFSFEIKGLNDPELANVNAFLEANLPVKKHRTEAIIREHFTVMATQIHAALEPFGYFAPSINAKLSSKGKGFKAVFNVKPGNPVLIDRVQLQVTGPGKRHRSMHRVIAETPIQKGKQLNTIAYERLKQDLFHVATSTC